MFFLFVAWLFGPVQPGADVVVVPGSPSMACPTAFAVRQSPYARDGRYVLGTAGEPSETVAVRVAAPEGSYYAYLTWVRHPRGAKDVAVRVGGMTVVVDQSWLANRLSPDNYDRDDMPEYQGLCTSGLFRVTARPVRFKKGDVVEIVRSDTVPGTVTTLESVVFSPYLYLDDVGNDAAWAGKPMINLKDYGRAHSGEIGLGLAFLKTEQHDAKIEWTLPAAGPCLVSANVSRGPSRAVTIPLEILLPDGKSKIIPLAGRSSDFRRGPWQDVGVLRNPQGARLRVKPVEGGVACVDLLRLTPLAESDLAKLGETRWDAFTVQWEDPSPQRPWLESVRIAPSGGVQVDRAGHVGNVPHNLPNGAQVKVARKAIRVLDGNDGSVFALSGEGTFQIELAHDYGLTFSAELVRREPFVWLKDLGIFACKDGDFASKRAEIDALAARVQAAGKEPFRSTSEKYFALTGYDEARARQDDRAFEFAYASKRPPAARVSESLAAMPEVDYSYFLKRVEDPKHRRMFLGWPNVCKQFYVLSNGAIGVSSGSGKGTGHAPAEHFTVQFGAGEKPQFKEHGDSSVTQKIEDGYHIIVETQWKSHDATVLATALACPLVGEEVRTGNEPLAAHVRLIRKSSPLECGDLSPLSLGHSQSGATTLGVVPAPHSKGVPLWLKIRPDHWGGPKKPLTGLAGARIEPPCLTAGNRVVLGFASAKANIAAASDSEVLVRLEPESEHVDLVIPYLAVDKALVLRALAVGFPEAMARTKEYWDRRLSAGAFVDTPDAMVNSLYKTLLPRTLVCGELDVQGDYVLKTSPIIYDAVWLHATAYGIEGLARRGHFAEARQYLEAAFRWQGSQASDAKTYTTWKGFFNAPPRYTALLWINFHGWMQWAAARYFLFSDDMPWLKEKLPALIDSLEWTASQRRLTMRTNSDGSRPDNYGWLPPGRVTDGSAGTSTFSDCINWMGFHELTRLLERIGHPRAREFRAIADDYRACILRGLRRAAGRREPVRLNDGTYIPYVPGYLESTGHEETMWYAAVVDGGLEGILDSGILPPGEPMEDWVFGNLEDNLFVMAPNLADEAYFLGHGCAYLRRDQPKQAIYTFYSVMASHMARPTLTTFEHRSWGANRVYDLAPWPMGYYTRMLAGILCYDEEEELAYCRATPRAWLEPGKRICVQRLQTRFGPTSFVLNAERDRIHGYIELPTRHLSKGVRLRLAVDGTIRSVNLNGKHAPFDPATSEVALPIGTRRVEICVGVRRETALPRRGN
jgi:hypothetical protein